MRALIFDTETTGLPKTKILTPEASNLWPYIVQFSYIIYDFREKTIIKIRDFIVRIPLHIKISDECIKIHGITNDISYSQGIPIEDVLTEFINDYNNVDDVVAHNLNFDLNMLKIELIRTVTNLFKNKENIYSNFLSELNKSKKLTCTMQESIDLCDIKSLDKKGKEFVKFPKLIELHKKLFDSEPKNLHNSLNDVIVCLRCYYKMKTQIDIIDESEELKNLFNELLV